MTRERVSLGIISDLNLTSPATYYNPLCAFSPASVEKSNMTDKSVPKEGRRVTGHGETSVNGLSKKNKVPLLRDVKMTLSTGESVQ